MKKNFYSFILFFGITFILVAHSFGATIEVTYTSITTQELFTPSSPQSDLFNQAFSLTNDTTEVWTDFHLNLNTGECLTDGCLEFQPIFVDSSGGGFDGTAYEGPGISTVSTGKSIIDVVDLNIPVGGLLEFTLDVNYQPSVNDGIIYGIPTTDGTGPLIPPVPEPGTMLLFGLGLLGVAGVSRRKN